MTEVSISADILTLIEDEGTATTFTISLSEPPPEGGLAVNFETGKEFSLGDFDVFPPAASFTGIGGFQGFSDNSGASLNIIAQTATISFPIFDDADRPANDPDATRNDDIGEEQTTFSIGPGDGYTVSPTASSVTLTLVDTAADLEPPEPTEPTEPTELTDPTDPTDPTNPVDPIDPTEPIAPTEPTDQIAPVDPAPDPFQGGKERDRIRGLNTPDTINGGGGRDSLLGLGGRDTITGGAGRDNIKGGNGKDTLFGDGGKDRISGGSGSDTLYGGGGGDTVIGNGGRDVFVLEQKSGRDTFRDFKDRKDRLGLSNGLEFDDLTFTDRGKNVLIKAGNNSIAMVRGINADQLTQADFVDI